jgi:hypothetical protein
VSQQHDGRRIEQRPVWQEQPERTVASEDGEVHVGRLAGRRGQRAVTPEHDRTFTDVQHLAP